jgi:hypothetical protein
MSARTFLIVAGDQREQHDLERIGLTVHGFDRVIVLPLGAATTHLRGLALHGWALTKWAEAKLAHSSTLEQHLLAEVEARIRP